MLGHAHVERSHPAQREEAVEWRAGYTQTVCPPAKLLAQCCVTSDDCPTDDVAMSVQILRRRMNDEGGAERDRLLEGRGEKRVVGNDERTDGVAGSGDAFDVGDAQDRIARRLDPDETG